MTTGERPVLDDGNGGIVHRCHVNRSALQVTVVWSSGSSGPVETKTLVAEDSSAAVAYGGASVAHEGGVLLSDGPVTTER